MVDNSNNKKRKEFISEGDIATLLQRYDTVTILKLLQEMAYYAEPKMDWNELVKKTATGITNAREYQLLWRHLAYRDSLLPVEDNAQLLNDDSDMECELEASPAVGSDAVMEAVAHVKVMAASYVPSDSDIPEDSTVEAPLTINIPYGLNRGAQEPSDSHWSSRGMNITFPVSLQKAAEGHNGNGLANSMAPRKRRKKWSVEEDEELIAAVNRRGEVSWALIAKEEFEGERTASQLSQRWGAIRRRCETSNTSTQSGLQRTEAQMAANRALSLAVGNRLPSKKLAVGIPSSGTTTGAQPNGANSGSTLQGQQQSQPVVQAVRAVTLAATAKSRVPAKKATGNSSSRAELMVTANSVAAAACMSGLATAVSVPKIEPGKNAVSALVPKTETVKTASAASLPCPSGVSSAVNAEPEKPASATSLPRPLGIISAPKAEPVKTAASAASLPRSSGIILAPKAGPVKTAASAPSFPRPSSIVPAPNIEPVKTAASAPSVPRPSGILSAPKASAPSVPRPSGILSAPKASAPSVPRPSNIVSAPNVGPVKTSASATSVPRPSGILSAPKAEPVKPASAPSFPRPSSMEPLKKSVPAAATNTKAVGPLNIRHAVNGSPNHVLSSSPSNKPSPMVPLSKGSPSPITPLSKGSPSPITPLSKASPSPITPLSKGFINPINSVPPSFASSRLVHAQRVPAATAMSQKPSVGAAVNASVKPVGVPKVQTQGNRASPLVTTTLQPNKTIATKPVISTGMPVIAKAETPTPMPNKNQVVGNSVDKSSLNKPPEKETSSTVSPLVGAAAESKPKDETSIGKSQDVATVTGTGQK